MPITINDKEYTGVRGCLIAIPYLLLMSPVIVILFIMSIIMAIMGFMMAGYCFTYKKLFGKYPKGYKVEINDEKCI